VNHNKITIGQWTLSNNLVLSPMAGITDKPFRLLCRQYGAGLAVAEMTSANPALRHTEKSRLRLDHKGEPEPRMVQIAGSDPEWMADAARFNVDNGAQIIDINMGCPAKKVCNKAAGSALLANEALVADILQAVVNAVDVPVTLKFRTGINPEQRNAINIARIAEDAGIQSLALHGRTRADAYKGDAEYSSIAAVKAAVKLPVFANGDINSPQKALQVLQQSNADGLYIGRGAQGQPWIFQQIAHYLDSGEILAAPSLEEQTDIVLNHLQALYAFYGEGKGLRIARKHLGWYSQNHADAAEFRRLAFAADSADQQWQITQRWYQQLQETATQNPNPQNQNRATPPKLAA
jgi:tRNA-dihydrouridine synthase B